MRIKNEKANREQYLAIEKANYDKLAKWYKDTMSEVLKSKCKIIQTKLLDFFAKKKKPTNEEVNEIVTEVTKYLKSYHDIKIDIDIVNSLDFDKTMFFSIYIDFNGFYRRCLIQENCHPNIDKKPVILDIEITPGEISEYVKNETIKVGNFEEI